MSITSTGTARMPAIPFHSITLVVAGVAAVVTFGTNWAMLSAPAMFLGWVAYGVTGETVRHRYANLASYVVGLAFGAGTTLVINRLQPSLGLAATGIAIFALVAIVMCLRALPMFQLSARILSRHHQLLLFGAPADRRNGDRARHGGSGRSNRRSTFRLLSEPLSRPVNHRIRRCQKIQKGNE
ncbi:DUF1097 domain-containing protein [Mycobacterium sp. 360MFTsu5.1]|uniref:DUF1097 domain-containing protein n=1 Tax=Mycobacterium sp. 360MFTsu5.1 TaxID=1172186 RepID=UPI000688D467|nr:DUF1097 domain-containing protein [Mycobacterium sp. 360MFTsu5.1]